MTEAISCNGQTIKITVNLASFPEKIQEGIRTPTSPLTWFEGSLDEKLASSAMSATSSPEATAVLPHDLLWVDAVCINEQDVSERNRHVHLMNEIYVGAERVLVWLNDTIPKEEDVATALVVVHLVNESDNIHSNWSTFDDVQDGMKQSGRPDISSTLIAVYSSR